MSQPRVAVLLPCYNEALTIGSVVRKFKEALPYATVYVYDNHSSDCTSEQAEKAGACVRYEPIRGKGAVVQRMFHEIDADLYIMCDGDGTYDLHHVAEHVHFMTQHPCDMMIGVRQPTTEQAYRKGHYWGNRLLTQCVSVLFGYPICDLLSGYRIMSRRFVRSFSGKAQGFEIETELTLHALNMNLSVEHVNVSYGKRVQGSFSKLSTFIDGFKILLTLLKGWVTYHPLMSCLIMGTLFWAGALISPWLYSMKPQHQITASLIGWGGGLLWLVVGLVLESLHQINQSVKHMALDLEPWSGLYQTDLTLQKASG